MFAQVNASHCAHTLMQYDLSVFTWHISSHPYVELVYCPTCWSSMTWPRWNHVFTRNSSNPRGSRIIYHLGEILVYIVTYFHLTKSLLCFENCPQSEVPVLSLQTGRKPRPRRDVSSCCWMSWSSWSTSVMHWSGTWMPRRKSKLPTNTAWNTKTLQSPAGVSSSSPVLWWVCARASAALSLKFPEISQKP